MCLCVACLRQFLHPSQDDSFRLLSFLLERLSEIKQGLKGDDDDIASSTSRPKVEETFRDDTFDMHIHKVEAVLKHLTMTPQVEKASAADGSDFFSLKTDDSVTDQPSLRQSSGYEEPSSIHPSDSEVLVLTLSSSLHGHLVVHFKPVLLIFQT